MIATLRHGALKRIGEKSAQLCQGTVWLACPGECPWHEQMPWCSLTLHCDLHMYRGAESEHNLPHGLPHSAAVGQRSIVDARSFRHGSENLLSRGATKW